VSATIPRDTAHLAQDGLAASEHRAAVTRFALTFKGAMAAVRRLRGRDTHRPEELSYAQYCLLFGLADRGELSASELAGLADVAPATATQMLDSLVAGGFVERSRSERDRRMVLVSLTARGSELVAARRARYEALWARAGSVQRAGAGNRDGGPRLCPCDLRRDRERVGRGLTPDLTGRVPRLLEPTERFLP
jgi:DNA-binding MarR family transcriptional regulator